MAKKKRKRLSKTILVYILTFIVVTFATAFLTVTVNYDNYMLNNSSNLMGNMGSTDSSALSSTISNLMGISCGAVNVSMTAEGENGESLDVDANIKLKMDNGIDSLECSVDVVLYFNGKPFVLRLACTKGMVYLTINESNFKFQADGLVNTIAGVLGIVGMGMDGASSIASMFDMNSLMGMASAIKEVSTDSGTSLQIKDANMNVSMNVDEDYMLQSVDIGSIAVGGFTATGAVTMSDINSNTITVEPPLQEGVYEDISAPIRVFSALSGLASSDFKAKANISAFGTRMTTEVVYDKQTNIGVVGMGAGAIDFDIYIAGGNFYFTSGNAKIKAADLSATSFIAGLGVIFNEFNGINQENGNGLAIDTDALTDLDLAGLSDIFKVDGNIICADIAGQKIYFTMDGDKISYITLNGDVDVTVKFDYADQNLFFNDFGYVPLEKMSWVLEPVTNFMTTRKLSTSIDYSYGDLSGKLMLRLDLQDRRAIQLNTELFGKNLEVIVDGDYILLNIDGEYSKIASSEVGFLALAIFDKLGGQIQMNTAFNIEQVLSSAMNLVFADENALMFKGKDGMLQYASDGNILYSGIVGGEKFNLFISIDKYARDIRDYNLKFYSDFVITSTLALNAKEYIQNKVYNFTLTGVYDDHKVLADVFADLKDQRFVFDISFAGQTVGVILQDGVYYISYRQFKFFGDKESAFAMLAGVISLGAGDADYAEDIANISQEVVAKASSVDLISLITDIKIKDITLKQGEFAISMEKLAGLEDVLDIDNIKLSLKAQDEHLKEIRVDYSNASLAFAFSRDIVEPLTDDQKALYHVSIDDLLEFGKNTFDYLSGGKYAFNVNLAYGNISLSGRLLITREDVAADLIISAGNQKIFVKVCGGKVYINYANLAFNAGLEDVGVALAILNKLGVELPQIDIDRSVNKLLAASDMTLDQTTICRILSAIDVDLIKFDRVDDKYILGYADYSICVDAADNKFGGISAVAFGASFDLHVIDEFTVEPVGDYVALGDLFKLGFFTYNYVQAGDYKFKVDASYDAYSVSGLVGINANEILASLDINIDGAHVYMKLFGGKLYVNYARLAFVGELADAVKLTAILAEFGLNVDVNEVSNMLNGMAQSMGDISLSDFDIYKLTLTEEDGVFTLGYDGYNVAITTTDGEIDSVSTSISGADFSIAPVDSVAVVITGEYVSVGDLLDFGKSVYDYAASGDYKFALSASYQGYSLSGLVGFNSNEILASLDINVDGEHVYLKLKENKLYINYRQFAFVGEAEDVAKLTMLLANFGLNVDTKEIETLLVGLKDKLNEVDVENIISNFDIYDLTLTKVGDVFTLGFGEYFLNFDTNINKITGINTTLEGASINLKIVSSINVEPIGNFIKLGDFISLVDNTIDYVNSNSYLFNINAEYDSFFVNGEIGVEFGELKAALTLTLAGEEIYIKINDGAAYLDFASLKFSTKLEDVNSLAKLLGKLGVDLENDQFSQMLGATLELSKTQISKEMMFGLIKTIDIDSIVFNEANGTYSIGYSDYVVNIFTTDNSVTGISTIIAGASVNVEKVDAINVQVVGDYVQLGKLLTIISNEVDYTKGNIAFKLGFNVGGANVEGEIFFDGKTITSQISTLVVGEPLIVNFIGDTLYIDLNGLKIQGTSQDYESLAWFIEKHTGISLPSIYKLQVKDILETYTDIVKFASEMIGVSLPQAPSAGTGAGVSKTSILDEIKKISFVNAENGFALGYGDLIFNIIVDDNKLTAVNFENGEIVADINKTGFKTISVRPSSYIQGSELVSVIDKTTTTLSTRALQGIINLDFMFENKKHTVDINYNINFENINDIRGKIDFEFKGVKATICYMKGIVYMDIAGLQLKVPLSEYREINRFVESRFNIDLGLDEFIDDLFKDIDSFDFISSWNINENKAGFMLKDGLGIFLDFIGDTIDKVTFKQGTVQAVISLVPMDKVDIGGDYSSYHSYTRVFDMIDSVLALGGKDGFNIHADAFVYEGSSKRFNIVIDLALAIKNAIKFYGEADVMDGSGNVLYDNVIAALDSERIYVNFEGLKLQIKQQSLMELLVVALSALGVDANSIPWLGAVDDDFKVVPDNLKDIIPVMNVDSLGMIALIKSMNLSGNVFTITLNGAMVSAGATRDMTIEINFAGNIVNSINLYNIYTGVTQSEYFNLEIDFNEFVGVPTLEDKDAKDADGNYIYKDISGASDLVGALVNTTELNDYTISGNVTFNAAGLINMTVGVNASVKILENNKTYAHISITNIPVVGIVNGTSGKEITDRTFNIYMYDNIVYLHRTEYQRTKVIIGWGEKKLVEKKLAITMEQFLEKILDYIMCFGLGFEEGGMIMDAIYESIAIKRPADDPIDYGNILLQYTEKEDKSHYFKLNMYEITYNENLKTIEATISTTNDAQTGNKDYLSKIGFKLVMPVSIVNLSLSSDNLQLINIGKEADVSAAINYINSYSFKLGETYVISGGKATLESNLTYMAYFYNGSELVRTAELNAGEPLDLTAVTKPNAVINGVEYVYIFTGWYTDSACTSKFESTVMPDDSIELYAGFKATACRKVEFDEQGGKAVDDRYELVGTPINLLPLENKFVTSGAYTEEYEFVGWLLDGTKVDNSFVVPDRDVTLVAGWKYVGRSVASALLTIVSGGASSNLRINVGEIIDFTLFSGVNSTTKFYKDSAFTLVNDITIMPENDLTLYARNQYTIAFSTGTNTSLQSITKYEGENVSLSSITRSYYDDGTKTCRIEYTFAGWYFAEDASTLYNGSMKMPYGGGTLVAKWTEKVRNYVTISFKVNTADSLLIKYTYSTAPASIRYLVGDTFNTNTVEIPTAYRKKLFGGTENLTFKGWKVNGTVKSSFVVTGDITLEASWS